MATPPRLVYIREGFPVGDGGWEYDDDWQEEKGLAFKQFEHELKSGPLQFNLKLHPDLTYFAENWCGQLPWSSIKYKQTQLEDYGFTSTRSAYQPWAPTPETPRIPIDWLAENPELAFELARESWFYSEASIPVFLHVCAESRQALKRWGYRLAFGTRSHSPRTWFHFERDLLHVSKIDTDPLPSGDYGTLLSGCCWDIGQFDPISFQRVKRLVLSDTHPPYNIADDLISVVPLFPNLTELFLEKWQAEDLIDWFIDEDGRTNWWTRQNKDKAWDALIREPRSCIASERIDADASTAWFNHDGELGLPRGDYYYTILEIQLTPSIRIIDHTNRGDLEGAARDLAAALTARMKTRGHHHWRVPAIIYIHTCPESLCQRLLRGRHQFWQEFSRLQNDLHQGLDLEVSHQSALEPQFGVSLGKTKREDWRWVDYFDHGFDSVNVQRFLTEPSRDKNALLSWYFDGPAIPEPSLHLVSWI